MTKLLQSEPNRAAPQYIAVGAMVIVVTLLHYITQVHIHEAHGIYRRLYYFPIIFAAFLGGWRAGLVTSLVICVLYIPHAFGWIGFDPAPTLEKILEMVLYVAVGLVTGTLVSRETATRRALLQTAAGLQAALHEKKQMEAELVRAARLAAVGRLSAGLAHEIRNPLASIKGAAEVLEDDFPSDHPKGRLLRILIEETSRLNTVLTRFLAFARPQSGKREVVNLTVEWNHVIDLVRHQEGSSGAAIDFRCPELESVEISGDREQVRQLFLNILLNGVQAAGPQGEVIVTLQPGGGKNSILCQIEDDGPGFSEEAIENFGTPFFTTKDGGTGLGLAICHRIVADLGGIIQVTNRRISSDNGARVVVELPGLSEAE